MLPLKDSIQIKKNLKYKLPQMYNIILEPYLFDWQTLPIYSSGRETIDLPLIWNGSIDIIWELIFIYFPFKNKYLTISYLNKHLLALFVPLYKVRIKYVYNFAIFFI